MKNKYIFLIFIVYELLENVYIFTNIIRLLNKYLKPILLFNIILCLFNYLCNKIIYNKVIN